MEIAKSNKTALIIGSTGLVGKHCLNYLLKSKAYEKVISLSRRSTNVKAENFTEVLIDFDRLDDIKKDIACDDLFICLGTTMKKAGSKEAFYRIDHNYVLHTATIAYENGASQCFVVSAINADTKSSFYYNRVKGQIELDLYRIGFWSLHIFRPSILLGKREEDRFLEDTTKMISKGVKGILGNRLKKYSPIEGKAVAKAMVKVAQKFREGLHIYESHYIQMIADDVEGKLKSNSLHT